MILALDPGMRRTGLLASPLLTHDRQKDRSLLDLVARVCEENAVERILVGHPLTQEATPGESAERSEVLARKLRDRVGLPVELVDERYSTAEAGRILAGRGRSRAQRDAVAAALILQAWLDAHRDEAPS